MQTVGIAVAYRLRHSGRGCELSYVAQVVEAFGSLSEAELKDRFARGETHFVMPHDGKPILRGAQFDWVDVEEIYRDVTRKIAKLSLKPANPTGRNRGLVAK